MSDPISTVLLFVLLPVAATIVGGIVAAFFSPGAQLQSGMQHFAAGVVLAAVAGEVLPELHEQLPWAVALGFALGVAVMIAIRALAKRLGAHAETPETSLNQPPEKAGGATGLILIVAIDIVVDGLLVGIGFVAGQEQGVILTLALTVEVLFLGLVVAMTLAQAGASRRRVIGTTAGLALLLAVSAVFGAAVFGGLTGFPLALVFSFAAAALLYLVVEELLIEAHEVPETPLSTSLFFAGFLALLILELLAVG